METIRKESITLPYKSKMIGKKVTLQSGKEVTINAFNDIVYCYEIGKDTAVENNTNMNFFLAEPSEINVLYKLISVGNSILKVETI